MNTKLLFLCLLLASALVASGCAGLTSGSTDNHTITDNMTAADNETASVEPITSTAPAVTPRPPTREGWAKPRDLTQQEKERAVEIALTVRELWLQRTNKPYRTEMVWFVKTGTGWTVTSDPKPDIPDALGYYPGVTISFNPPPTVVFDIAVDLETGIPVRFRQSTVEEHFFPKPLTDEEKTEAIRIASEAIGLRPVPANASFEWFAFDGIGISRHAYDIAEKGLTDNCPLNADYYPGVILPSKIRVIVDLESGKALDVWYPAPPRNGPARNPNLP